MNIKLVCTLIALCAATVCMGKPSDLLTVKTTSGLVKGIEQEGTKAWLGIPYAKVERFMPPLPVDKWDGVRVCDHWGPQVMQQTNREMSEEEMSEKKLMRAECLDDGHEGKETRDALDSWRRL